MKIQDAPKAETAAPKAEAPTAPKAEAPTAPKAAAPPQRPEEAATFAKIAEKVKPELQTAGIRLYVNCVPNGTFETLDAYVNEAVGEVTKKFDVADIRVPPNNDHVLGYSRWRGVLAAMVRLQPPKPGDYVVFTKGNELSEVVTEALVPQCYSVVRGV
jgi:hypothetical protein